MGNDHCVTDRLEGSNLIVVLLCRFVPKGKYILTPCPISYAEEQLLHFFGQLLGIAIRADVPLPLDLLGSFWKGLVGEPLDPEQDLQEADLLTYNYVKKIESVRDSHIDSHMGSVIDTCNVVTPLSGKRMGDFESSDQKQLIRTGEAGFPWFSK